MAGLDVAAVVFRMLDESLRFTANVPEGSAAKTGTVVDISCAGSLAEAVSSGGASGTDLEMEVEAATIDDVKTAIEPGVRRILLDNRSLDTVQEAARLTANRAILEASGNVTLANVRRIAETGVDYISVGALTHSAKVFDVSLKFHESDQR